MDSHHGASVGAQPPAPAQAAAHVVMLIRRLFPGVHRPEEAAGPSSTMPEAAGMTVDVGTADFLRVLAAGSPERKEQERKAAHDQEALADKRRIKGLLETHLQDAMWNELLSHIQPAAERGEHEFQLLSFPSDLCSDGGRKIRIGDEDWKDTLQGEAAELSAALEERPAAKGYRPERPNNELLQRNAKRHRLVRDVAGIEYLRREYQWLAHLSPQ